MMTKQETQVQLRALAAERSQMEALQARNRTDLETAQELDDVSETNRAERDIRKADRALDAIDKQISLLTGRAEPKRQAQAQRTEKTAGPATVKR